MFHILDITVVAYWDDGSCGPYGDDANWEWCDNRSGGPCQNQVSTQRCPSGSATLQYVHGNQFAKDNHELQNYERNGCYYAYYAIYKCDGNKRINL